MKIFPGEGCKMTAPIERYVKLCTTGGVGGGFTIFHPIHTLFHIPGLHMYVIRSFEYLLKSNNLLASTNSNDRNVITRGQL